MLSGLAVLAGVLVPAAPAAAFKPYTHVATGQAVLDDGVRFGPGDDLTRGQMASATTRFLEHVAHLGRS